MKTFYRSFAAGELSPEMFGRLDLPKYQTGLKQCINFRPKPHGPVDRRCGLEHRMVARSSSNANNRAVRILPYILGDGTGVILEFGHQYIRVHTESGVLLDAAKTVTAMTAADPGVFTITGHGWENGQWVYCQSSDTTFPLHGQFFLVANKATNTFQLDPNIPYGDPGSEVSTVGLSLPATLTFARVYTFDSSIGGSPPAASIVSALNYAQDTDVMTLVDETGASVAQELRISGGAIVLSTPTFGSTADAPSGITASATIAVSTNLVTQEYAVTGVADGGEESLLDATSSTSNNLGIHGNFNTVTWTNNGSARYNVYKKRAGVWGFIGQGTDGAVGVIDDNIVPDVTLTPPQSLITLNSGAGSYPRVVAHFEERRWFAATLDEPHTIWATQIGLPNNFNTSVPTTETDALKFTLKVGPRSAIKHLVPLTDLIALTEHREARIFADGGPAITPTTLSRKAQGNSGTTRVQPALTNTALLFVEAGGARVRELAYDPAGSGYRPTIEDITILAPHLFTGYTIRRLAFTRNPDPTLWVLRSDGVLLSLTYVPEQQVYAWAQQVTDGVVEDIAVIPGALRDVLFLVVQRQVTGFAGAPIRCIERLTERNDGAGNIAYMDSFIIGASPTSSTVRGLRHLRGQEVQIVTEQGSFTGTVDSEGELTLPAGPATSVRVGRAYTSTMETLPAVMQLEAFGQGRTRNVSNVYFKVADTVRLKVGVAEDLMVYVPLTDFAGTQIEELEASVIPQWNEHGRILIKQDLPVSTTIAAFALDIAVGG